MRLPSLPFSSVIRCCVEAGMGLRVGVPMHASLVEKDGEGVLFLGPSGMGKSTQARLWKSALDADFISGDRPGLRLRTFCTFSSSKLVHFKLLSNIARNRHYKAL